MDPDVARGPVGTDQFQSPDNGNGSGRASGDATDGAGERVLVLSPGVTLTLGRDALLMSGMFPDILHLTREMSQNGGKNTRLLSVPRVPNYIS